QSKAGSLLLSMNKIDALQFAGIPDSILKLEQQLRVDRTYYNQKYVQQTIGTDAQDSLLVVNYHSKWLENARRHHELIQHIESEYPKYYQLKYNLNTPAISEVQQQLIDQNSAILEYFVSDSTIFIFTITQHQFDVIEVKDVESILIRSANLRAVISQTNQQPTANKNLSLTSQHHATYRDDASTLYDQILAPAVKRLPPSISKLLIVPDNQLGYLPFELLLTEPVCDEQKRYVDYPFLLKQYTINYGYGVRLLMNESQSVAKSQYHYGGFAPIYLGGNDQYATQSTSDEQLEIVMRNGLNDLPAARKSIANISRLLSGDAYLSEQATEANFKQKADLYNILHLAMHSVVNSNNPLYSKLVFSPVDDQDEDNFLNAMELYDMQLTAELAVLGACNTGYGEIQQGEGIMSISRAFAYAGCPSIVASLWNIPDESTAELTQRFFKALKAGLPKDEALRKAKLSYLNENPDRLTAPFFWAGIVHIGNADAIAMAPINGNNYGSWLWLLLGLGVVASGSYQLLRKRTKLASV
ncbi:MAG: CHAT domain-containing protein, partial [Bacteroidota bacterium]